MKTDLVSTGKTDFTKEASNKENEEGKVEEKEIIYSKVYTEAMHQAHYPAMFLSLILALAGIIFAFIFYYWKKISANKVAKI